MGDVETVMCIFIRILQGMDKWGHAHTPLSNVLRCLPAQFRDSLKGKKAVKKATKELINRGFMLAKPSTGEIHVSLNPHNKKEIIEFRKRWNAFFVK